MNAREELLHDFDKLVDSYHASRQETRAMLNQYAIGRWVSVDERLPEFGEEGDFMGFVKFRDQDRPVCYYFHDGLFVEAITHWLDLSMPSGKEDA